MTPDEIENDRTKGAMCAPDPHARDYKAAMLYHSDRADAYMTERDALTAENAALKERVAELEGDLTKILQDTGDAIANALEQMTKGNWHDDMGHAVHMNTHMMHLRDTLAAMVNYREAHPFTLPNRATLENRGE